MAKTLGFYQNFNLTLQRLGSALRCVQKNPQASRSNLAECMGVNTPVAEGFTGWLTHTGLTIRADKRYKLTPFGALVCQHDPFLSDLGTQWVIHYHLAAEHAERSDAWYVFINEFLTPGQRFSREQFQAYFTGTVDAGVKNRSALKKDPSSVLYTYVQSKSLGQLGLLRKEKKTYISGYPNLPHILVIGFMLLDWWQRKYPGTDTLPFFKLHQEAESLGRLCQADAAQVKHFVAELTNLGYLNFSETQHEPINRLYKEASHLLLDTYYQHR